MSDKPEALRLAEQLAEFDNHNSTDAIAYRASEELERLHAEVEALRADAAQAVRSERSRCFELAKLAISYAGDADWSRVDAVICLIERPAAMAKEQTK